MLVQLYFFIWVEVTISFSVEEVLLNNASAIMPEIMSYLPAFNMFDFLAYTCQKLILHN